MNATTEVWYHGGGHGAGPRAVVVEDAEGHPQGVLHNAAPRKSPDGFSWGYGGAGPAALAKSLLVAVLGEAASCPTCKGTRQIIWPLGCGDPIPFDTARMDECDPASVSRCYDCDDGYRGDLPYQDFKSEFVVRWGEEWRMSRARILSWLAKRGIRP